MKSFLSGLSAFALIATPVAAIAQEIPAPDTSLEIAGGGTAFTDRLGLLEVAPNLFVTNSQIGDIGTYGCTGGPDALYSDRETKMEWCSRASNGDLGRYLKSGARAWFLMATPAGLQLEIYMKGKSRDPNVRCWGMVGYRGFAAINLTCVDTANGTMFWNGVLGNLIGNGGSMAIGAAVSNLTAPKAGDYTINAGSQSGSNATSSSTGGGGAPVHIQVNPLFDVRAGAAANVAIPCPSGSVCK